VNALYAISYSELLNLKSRKQAAMFFPAFSSYLRFRLALTLEISHNFIKSAFFAGLHFLARNLALIKAKLANVHRASRTDRCKVRKD